MGLLGTLLRLQVKGQKEHVCTARTACITAPGTCLVFSLSFEPACLPVSVFLSAYLSVRNNSMQVAMWTLFSDAAFMSQVASVRTALLGLLCTVLLLLLHL